jgi:uncharacterized protein YbgA (DUF1722 family)/uncharacterized protein YbbK (DUF523 family)
MPPVSDKIKLGISTCLLGERVRYDGGHKLDRFLVHTLGQFVDFVPVCPEVESGFPVPREALRLVGSPDSPRLVTQKTGMDVTERMLTWAHRRLDVLAKERLCGFIFKTRSPSSGMERVKVYNDKGGFVKSGVGIFARAFMDRFPLMPVEDEGRLHDIDLRENFIVRIFAYKRWHDTVDQGKTRRALVDFHSRHKLLFMAHNPALQREMGKLVAAASQLPEDELFSQYEGIFMRALKTRATVKKNTNALQHMVGYFKKQLTADEKQELVETVEHYHLSLIPLVAPLTLIKHYVRKYGQEYLRDQYYLDPHPLELKLRNHA